MLTQKDIQGTSIAMLEPSRDDIFDLGSLDEALDQPIAGPAKQPEASKSTYATTSPQKQQTTDGHGLDSILREGEIEDLFNVAHQLYTSAVRDDNRRPFLGADIPLNARMTAVWAGKFVTDFAIHIHEGDSAEVKLAIPIYRKWWDAPGGTIGLLIRRPQDPLVTVVSGRTTYEEEERQQLRSAEWRGPVFAMCEAIGHRLLPNHHCDEYGVPGSYLASHAEMQLLACLYFSSSWPDEATIHVSKKVCPRCAEAIRIFQEDTGIDVTVLDEAH